MKDFKNCILNSKNTDIVKKIEVSFKNLKIPSLTINEKEILENELIEIGKYIVGSKFIKINNDKKNRN